MHHRRHVIATAIAACAVLLAFSAAAIDGEILIDQAKVNAGGITPGDAPGFPATLGKSSRYKLTGNLKVPAGEDGIEVAADGVSIDLNGFTISSKPPGEAQRAIQISGSAIESLRVMNGTITGFEAIGVGAGPLSVIENMRVVSNGHGLAAGSNSRILNSTIANNAFDGVIGTGCTGCLVERNVITGNGLRGVVVANGSLLLGNIVASNEREGIIGIGASSTSGYGNNVLFGNNGGAAQTAGFLTQLHPNACLPACP